MTSSSGSFGHLRCLPLRLYLAHRSSLFDILVRSVIIMSNVTTNATVSGLEVFWGCRNAWGLSPFWLAVAVGLFVVVGVGWLVERRGRLVVGVDLDEAVSFMSKLFVSFLSWVAGKKMLGSNGLFCDVTYRCRACFVFESCCS